MFSATRSGFRLPGIGTIPGAFASSQASATWPALICLRSAISRTRSTIGWFAASASGEKRGKRLRMSASENDSSRPTVPVRKP